MLSPLVNREGLKAMSYGVWVCFAVSLLLTGFNDVLFKRYSTGGRSVGIFVFGVGLLWTFAQWSPCPNTGNSN